MVKKIKKRVPKAEPTPEELEAQGLDSADTAERDDDVVVPEVLNASSVPSGEGPDGGAPAFTLNVGEAEYQDGFLEVAERIFSGFVEYWRVLLALFVIGAGVWGVQSQMKASAHADLSEARAKLEKANNAEGFAALKGSLGSEGLASTGPVTLATLGEASARFDAAKSEADFKTAAALFMSVARDAKVEPLARSVAFQSGAAAFEQASAWGEAAGAWGELAKLDDLLGEHTFGLFAGLQQAKALIEGGKKAEAKALVEALKATHAERLKDPKRKAMARELTLTALRAQ